jgi:hypothetical protein
MTWSTVWPICRSTAIGRRVRQQGELLIAYGAKPLHSRDEVRQIELCPKLLALPSRLRSQIHDADATFNAVLYRAGGTLFEFKATVSRTVVGRLVQKIVASNSDFLAGSRGFGISE